MSPALENLLIPILFNGRLHHWDQSNFWHWFSHSRVISNVGHVITSVILLGRNAAATCRKHHPDPREVQWQGFLSLLSPQSSAWRGISSFAFSPECCLSTDIEHTYYGGPQLCDWNPLPVFQGLFKNTFLVTFRINTLIFPQLDLFE